MKKYFLPLIIFLVVLLLISAFSSVVKAEGIVDQKCSVISLSCPDPSKPCPCFKVGIFMPEKVRFSWPLDPNLVLRQMTNPLKIYWVGGVGEVKLGILRDRFFNVSQGSCLKDSDLQESLMGWLTKDSMPVNYEVASLPWNGRSIFSRSSGAPTNISAINPYYSFENNDTKLILLSKLSLNGIEQWKDQNGCYLNWAVSDKFKIWHRDQVVLKTPSKISQSTYKIGDTMNISWDGGYEGGFYDVSLALEYEKTTKNNPLCSANDFVGSLGHSTPNSYKDWIVSDYYGGSGYTKINPGVYKISIIGDIDLNYEGGAGVSENNNGCFYNWDLSANVEITESTSKAKIDSWLKEELGKNNGYGKTDENTGKNKEEKSFGAIGRKIGEINYKKYIGKDEGISFSQNLSSLPYKPIQDAYISEDKNIGDNIVAEQPKVKTEIENPPKQIGGTTSVKTKVINNSASLNNQINKSKTITIQNNNSYMIPTNNGYIQPKKESVIVSSSEISKIQTQPQIQSNIPTSNNFPTQTNQGYKVTQSFQAPSFIQPLSSFQTTPSPSNLNIVSGYKVWAR